MNYFQKIYNRLFSDEITLRIVSDGTAGNTVVYTSSGQKVKNIQAVHLEIDAQEPVTKCQLFVYGVSADIQMPIDVLVEDDQQENSFPAEGNVISFEELKERFRGKKE